MKNWVPTQESFRQFLGWLDEGTNSGGERYLELRQRPVRYFDRRNCLAADELADETLSRAAQKFQEQGEITNLSPAHYGYITARFVFLEYTRRPEQGDTSFEEFPGSRPSGADPASASQIESDAATREKTLDCLERCLKQLAPDDKDLILEYYQGDQQEKIRRRKQIAEKLGVSANALSIRACRIRNKLEGCVCLCCDKERRILADFVL